MKSLLLLLVLASLAQSEKICAPGYSKGANGKCYGLIYGTHFNNWNDANNNCKSHGGASLAMPKSQDENDALLNYLSDKGVTSVWFGLKCFGQKDKSKCQWNDGSYIGNGWSNFENGSPISNDECVQFDVSNKGRWKSQSINKAWPFVCELPQTNKDCGGNCDTNYNNNCYQLISQYKTFDNAESYCKQQQGHLASVHSSLENTMVSEMYKNAGQYWLGGHMDSSKKITWVDGSSANYSPGKHSDDGNCVQVKVNDDGSGGDWYGRDCEHKSYFICKRAASC